ncbi:hypothetical protein CYMTET_48533 [Cymbomonas tetramitiformis]|uniref:Uncharacterized protein n=1 Tax=Cymbomonas tetramitiformis TaxID=36881 RepID=A0AAE0BT63_9CHLO|nr:hypothetical protein CYMTET_48533 [Cymbomonas tetramitiformis]
MLKLSVEGKENVVRDLKALLSEGILPSVGGDIWSQGGTCIFGILVYWLDAEFAVNERLLATLPFSSVRHTSLELAKATKHACADFGLGQYEEGLGIDALDTVTDFVHATCSDNANNIVSGWESFDGHECCAHTIALVVHAYLGHPTIRRVFRKLRGMATHYNHSVIGANDCSTSV